MNLPSSIPYRTLAVAAIAILAIIGWFWFKPSPPPVGEHVPARIAPQVKGIPKVDLKVPKVKVYASIAKAKLKLPAADVANPDIHVIESSRIEPDIHPQTITTLIDAGTGETTTLIRREPDPWFALKKTGALGLNYDAIRGLKTLYVRQDLLQSKAIFFSGSASIRSDLDKAAGFQIEYRW
jgi:hypothetical protein